MIRSLSRLSRRPLLCCTLLACLLAVSAPLADAQAGAGLPAAYPAGSLHGQAALDALGGSLSDLAGSLGTTPDALRQQFLNDPSLWIDAHGRLFFVDSPQAPRPEHHTPANNSYAGSIPTSDAFTLHSRPGANKVLFLDFDGHHSVSNSWGHNIQFPPYNTSGDSQTFTSGELNEIITWWQYVAEDYAPFDVDVTTEEPPPGGLTKSGGGDQTWGIRAVITQPTSGFGNGIGGVAFLNSFDDSIDNPVFVFNKGNNNGSMSASHETGHSFGLSHDGLNGQEYHPGTGSGETSWGPIMGAPFGKSLVQWSNGDYAGATTGQNDVNIITKTANGVHFMPDDHSDTAAGASAIPPGVGCPVPLPGSLDGLIETRTDVDAFWFTTPAGQVTVAATPTSPGGNLDLQIDLLDSSGVPLASMNDANQADAILTLTLPAGTYTVLVDGVGKSGVYSDYGSLGQYTVSVTLPGTELMSTIPGSVAGSVGIPPILQVLGTACPGNAITMNVFAAPPNAPAYLMLGLAELGLPFKGGVLVPDTTPPGAVLDLTTNGLGAILLTSAWPTGLPPDLTFYFQFWIKDAGAPAGFAATDGVSLFAP